MLIEIISSNTIKVELDELDMSAYDISFDKLDRSSPETRKLLVDLIDDINKEKDIDLTEERIFVEAFPKDDGGCLLYLSMLGNTITTAEKNSIYNSSICKITTPETLSKLASELYKLYNHITHNSELYYKDGNYFLILHTFKRADKKLKYFLNEYCEIIGRTEIDCSYIREYSQCIFSVNAIEEINKRDI